MVHHVGGTNIYDLTVILHNCKKQIKKRAILHVSIDKEVSYETIFKLRLSK